MITIFAEKAQLLSKKPSELVSLTHSFLKEAASYHHPHNKLLPAQYIKQLMSIFETYSLTSSNIHAAYQLLASSSLSVLLRANFNQLAQNKLFGALILQYTVILQNLSAEIKRELPQIFSYFKFAARGLVFSKIINKLLERTHSFLPQFYRFARVLVEVMGNLTESLSSIDSEEDQLGKLDLQQSIVRMCFSKKVSLKNLGLLLKGLLQQLNHESTICAPSSQIQIFSIIKEKCQQICSNLPTQYKVIMEEVEEEAKQNKNENVYLEQAIAVKELTPRMYDDEQAFIVNKLRKSKLKLKKKIENDLRKDVLVRQQEAQILQDVRKEKIDRQHKKELYVIEKQTAQARKFHKSMEKVKKIRKDGKGKQGGKPNFGAKGRGGFGAKGRGGFGAKGRGGFGAKGRGGKMGDKNKSGKMSKHRLGFKK